MSPTVKKKHSLIERIDARFDIVSEKLKNVIITENNCWQWQGSISKSRGGGEYGRFSFSAFGESKYVLAHRASYAFHHGVDPGDLQVCHKCDNGMCINPDHLFLGTAAQNMEDMVEKGRSAKQSGALNHNAKIDKMVAQAIMRRIDSGGSNKSIADEYGISHGAVSLIRLGKNWKDAANEIGFEPKPSFKRKKTT